MFVCFFFFEMRWSSFNQQLLLGLPTSLGFEWGAVPVLLSFKFTFDMFLLLPAHCGDLLQFLKFAVYGSSVQASDHTASSFLDLWQRE